MLFEWEYPPGVIKKTIDALEVDERCCENCLHYNGDYCTADWNNGEEDYKVPARDQRDPEDYCDRYESEEDYE